jgi:hypothetical protein
MFRESSNFLNLSAVGGLKDLLALCPNAGLEVWRSKTLSREVSEWSAGVFVADSAPTDDGSWFPSFWPLWDLGLARSKGEERSFVAHMPLGHQFTGSRLERTGWVVEDQVVGYADRACEA